MSLKDLIKDYCPAPAIKLAKGVRKLGRLRSSRILRKKLLGSANPIKLELGSGGKRGLNGWTTLDLVEGCDLYCNLAKGIPFPDNSVAEIYSSHFFEHLTFRETQGMLDECVRVMAPNGKFSICVPNARLFLNAYLNNETLDDKKFAPYEPGINRTTKIDYANYVAYMDGQHKYMFDEDNLIHILKDKGFKNVQIRQFDAALDREARDYESIYAEGYK